MKRAASYATTTVIYEVITTDDDLTQIYPTAVWEQTAANHYTVEVAVKVSKQFVSLLKNDRTVLSFTKSKDKQS